MNVTENITKYHEQLRQQNGHSALTGLRDNALKFFTEKGVPTAKNEEWKYTRVSSLFNKGYALGAQAAISNKTTDCYIRYQLPGHAEANSLVFVNGLYTPTLSVVQSDELQLMNLEEASNGEHAEFISKNIGSSSKYQADGVHALNTAYLKGGVFVQVQKGKITTHPLYIYHIVDAGAANILALPRILVHLPGNSQLQIVETYITDGMGESFTNQVTEVVVDTDARLEYYKIQNDTAHTNQVNTTHIRQVGKSFVQAVTSTLDGNIVRNNINVVLEADHCEAHLYGLYFLNGKSHVDNHSVVDNVRPNCFSNELYKGIMNDESTGVFNGKIFVRQAAQKTNAFQSNKNILLSDNASVNTKPQLEIFADDVKCSHGCTVGQLDEEGLFYLRSRGIDEKMAKSLLVQAYVIDIIENIKLVAIRNHVEHLIAEKLELI